MAAGMTRIERARGFLDAAKLSEDWLATMRSHAFLLEAHHTTHIEGTRLTLEQAERLLAGEVLAGTDPDDVRELLNYRDAFEFVSGYLNDGGPVTEVLIREIHRRNWRRCALESTGEHCNATCAPSSSTVSRRPLAPLGRFDIS